MNMSMSKDPIAELEGLLAAATALPWRGDPEPYCEYLFGPNQEMIAQMRGVGEQLPIEANRDLILAMVNRAPQLLATLKELRAEFEAIGHRADYCAMDVSTIARCTCDYAERRAGHVWRLWL